MAAWENIDAGEAGIVQITQPAAISKAEILQHLSEVMEGDAFRGSPRGARFLKHIVEHALGGDFESLKERVIGVELFGRSASYDTGEDAIVRVTACDVRKRLLQHYKRYGTESKFRLGLPLGSYVPEFVRIEKAHPPDISATGQKIRPPLEAASTEAPGQRSLEASGSTSQVPGGSPLRPALHWVAVALSLIAIVLVSWDLYHNSTSQPRIAKAAPPPLWPAFFRAAPVTNVITSDPNIAEIQGFTGGVLSVSDYANHNYYAGPNKLSPEQVRFCRMILSGDKGASFDSVLTAKFAELAALNGKSIVVRAARDVQFSNLKTDDNFIFLGSPRTDPWFALFNDQLDFQFTFDKEVQSEFIRNVHPRANEQSSYVPSAIGGSTGQSYAVIALVRNPDQKGQVLLLAGATTGATEAAGKIATDPSLLTPMLKRCGVEPSGPLHDFELLLHLNIMVGSASSIDYAACHTLPVSATVNQP